MANKKIIFLIIVGIIVAILGVGLLFLSNSEKKPQNTSGSVKIWINDGTTEDFQKLIDGFYASSPAHRNIAISVEKKSTTTTSGYNTMLLTAIANKTGPDIFMLPRGEDANLESQALAIPDGYINISEFQRRFDGVFDDLVTTTTNADKTTTKELRGVPLGYEMLGVFYNKSLLRTGVPREWEQIETLYGQFPTGKFPTNFGLGKNFVPNVTDILGLFLIRDGITSYDKLSNTTSPFQNYYSYGDLSIGTNLAEENIYAQNDTLRRTETQMSEQKPRRSTLDEFIRGNIGMIIGYPGLIKELEDAHKRAGSESAASIIFTDALPQNSRGKKLNLARYQYFTISKNISDENLDAATAFMNYLTTEDAGRIALEIYPNLIPAQTTFLLSTQSNVLSGNFPKTTLDAFMPQAGIESVVFDYGFKDTFRDIIDKNWDDFASRTAISGLGDEILKSITSNIQTTNQ